MGNLKMSSGKVILRSLAQIQRSFLEEIVILLSYKKGSFIGIYDDKEPFYLISEEKKKKRFLRNTLWKRSYIR